MRSRRPWWLSCGGRGGSSRTRNPRTGRTGFGRGRGSTREDDLAESWGIIVGACDGAAEHPV